MKALLIASALLLATVSAHAAQLGSCANLDTIANLTGATRKLPNAARLAVVETNWEDANSLSLLVFTYGDDDYSQCVSVKPNLHPGYSDLDIAHAQVTKQSDLDYTVIIPAKITDDKTGKKLSTAIKLQMHEEFPAAKVTLVK